MSGTVSGGKKAAQKNITLHGKEFYREIGRKGGKNSKRGGFASEKIGKDGLTGPERAKKAGTKGGKISKRGPAKRGGRVINANYTKDQLERIGEELGWNNDKDLATLDEIEKKVKLLNIELERLRNETTK